MHDLLEIHLLSRLLSGIKIVMTKILLIEDDEDIRLNIAEVLQLARYDVVSACNGKEGVEMVRTEHPDLIVCDVMMPVMDGFGVLHVLQMDEKTQNIPFIFLTSKNSISDLRHAMNLGADDYIIKPFEGSDLLDAIGNRLKKAEQAMKAIAQETSPETTFSSGDPLASLIDSCEVAAYKKKQVIFKEGSTPRFLYYIKKGKVRTYKSHEYGKDLVVGLFGENDFVGYTPVFENSFHIETAEVIEDAELVLIPRKSFEDIVNTYPQVQKKFVGLLAKNLAEIEEQVLGFAYNTLRKKVAKALVTLGTKYRASEEKQYTVNMSREDLASLAGTATESLIRTLSEFKQEKLIDIQNGTITIVDTERLQHLVA